MGDHSLGSLAKDILKEIKYKLNIIVNTYFEYKHIEFHILFLNIIIVIVYRKGAENAEK